MEKILIGMLRIADRLWNDTFLTIKLLGVTTAAALIYYALKGWPVNE